MTESQKWLLVAGVGAGAFLVYQLAPVLTPFVAATLLAYVGDPVVGRLQRLRLPRTLAVVIVFLVLGFAVAVLVVVLVPLLEQEIAAFVRRFPAYLDWMHGQLSPILRELLGPEAELPGLESLKQAAAENWREAGGLAAGLFADVSRSGFAFVAWLGQLVLVPVVTFYLLRDWDALLERVRALLPRSTAPLVVAFARESDQVLGQFLRGQLAVMGVLALIYSVGLWLIGINLALLIGGVAGLVSFVPYLGLLLGVLLAGLTAYLQFQELLPVLYVVALFGVAQIIETALLTPTLVGERIGLHPVAVIFAVLAGGQLFGFVGVLLALPAAAVAVVLLRHVYTHYRGASAPPSSAAGSD